MFKIVKYLLSIFCRIPTYDYFKTNPLLNLSNIFIILKNIFFISLWYTTFQIRGTYLKLFKY